jgi:hypothetical protein
MACPDLGVRGSDHEWCGACPRTLAHVLVHPPLSASLPLSD